MSTMRTTSSIAWGKILPTTKVKYRCSQKNLNFCVSTIAIDHFERTTLFLCSTNNNTTSVQFILLQIKTSTELHEQQESKVNTTTLVRPNSSLGPTLLYPSHVRSNFFFLLRRVARWKVMQKKKTFLGVQDINIWLFFFYIISLAQLIISNKTNF